MGRVGTVLAWCVLALIALPFILVGAVLIGANTGPGRRAIETATAWSTGGMVHVAGIAGRFPDAIQIRELRIADEDGVWVTVDNATLAWSPLRLLKGEVSVERLEAGTIALDRLPKSEGGGGGAGTSMPPLRVTVSRLRVEHLAVGAGIAGRAFAMTVEGSGRMTGPNTGQARLAVTAIEARATGRPDDTGTVPDDRAPDRYTVELSVDPSRLHATLAVTEGTDGLIAGIARLPGVGAINLRASADGPPDGLATEATVDAGPLRAKLNGTVDSIARMADLEFSVIAPAMTAAPEIAWSSLRLEGNLHGALTSPTVAASIAADELTSAGAAIGSLRATLSGAADGKAELNARTEQLRLPGPSPDILAGGPLTLRAAAQLNSPKFPTQFELRHQLFSAEGTADTANVRLHLTVPDLTPFAAIGGIDLKGQAAMDIGAARVPDGFDLTAKGDIGIAGGPNPVPVLVGNAGTIDLAASLRGEAVTLDRLSLNGGAFKATASGVVSQRLVNLDWTVSLPDLNAVRPGVAGAISARGHAGGSLDALSVTSDVTGDAAGEGGRREQFEAHLKLDGLPDAPVGHLTAGGTIAGSPLSVEVGAARNDTGLHLTIDRFAWKSLAANGALDLAPGESLPTGKASLAMPRIADLAPLVGMPVAGAVTASVDAAPDATRISIRLAGAAMPGVATVERTELEATISDPARQPVIDGTLTLDGVDAGGQPGSGRLTAKGPLDGLALSLAARAAIPRLGQVHVETAAMLNATGRTLSLTSARVAWKNEAIRLLAPARIAFAQGVAVDSLRLGFRQAELTMAARLGEGSAVAGESGITPRNAAAPASGARGDTFDFQATLRNLPADAITVVLPDYPADGTITGEAKLTGVIARPKGTIRLNASRVRLRAGPGRALPAADLSVSANLDGPSARLDSKLTAGTSNLSLTGQIPTDPAGPLDLHATGAVDLAMLNPFLAAQGRNARGRLDLAVGIGGTPPVPKISGTARLTNGEAQDASLGAHVTAINATVRADGDTVRLERFDAKAGPGTLSASGTIGLAGARQVDLTLRANNARLLSSDLATAWTDATLFLRGPLSSGLTSAGPAVGGQVLAAPLLGGTLLVRKAEIQVPEKLPPTIVVLPVRDANAPPAPPPPPSSMPDIGLDLTLDAPGQVYIRGRGLDVELGGKVAFTGTASRPVPHGGLQLRRGSFSLAGQSLNLTEGTIDFTGGGLANPRLRLVATSTTATMVSTLTISGDVKDPKITLSSVPDLPQDEILSQLLFRTSKGRLSPFQLAQIAGALASMAGVDSPVGDPLARLRTGLGLDQLSVGSDARGGATLEAGRYLAPGVRLGARQGVTGGETQATVQIDIAKGLKLETTAGTGSTSATGAGGGGGGASVGVTYQFEY